MWLRRRYRSHHRCGVIFVKEVAVKIKEAGVAEAEKMAESKPQTRENTFMKNKDMRDRK